MFPMPTHSHSQKLVHKCIFMHTYVTLIRMHINTETLVPTLICIIVLRHVYSGVDDHMQGSPSHRFVNHMWLLRPIRMALPPNFKMFSLPFAVD